MKKVIGILVSAFVVTGFCAQDALALPEFKKAFLDKYVKPHKSKELQTMAKKAGCNICHIKGSKDKHDQNEYGKLLNKLIEGDAKKRKTEAKNEGGLEAQKKEREKILAELEKAFAKVGETKSEGGKGPKFAELIKAGKLPVDPAKATAIFKAEQAKKKAAGAEVTDNKDN